jgi:two-component system, cell cycle sensor histidine kinase and response regulator CckA
VPGFGTPTVSPGLPNDPVTSIRLLESPTEEGVDRLARLAARLLGAPVALVSEIGEDRVFLRSAIGVPEPWASHRTMPLAYSFCRHVVTSGAPLVVEDARRHPIVRSNPAIRELSWIAYAGVPLVAADGRTHGTLCVIDALPRLWSPRDVALLEDLAASVATELAMRAMVPGHSAPRDSVLRPVPAGTRIMPDAPAPDPVADVFEVAALPMGVIGGDGRWLKVNRAMLELLNTKSDALVGAPAELTTHAGDRAADREAARLMLAGECASYTAEKRLLRADGDAVWVLATVTALTPKAADGPRTHVACHEIDDRKAAEVELRGREERYRLVAQSTQDAVWDWDLLTDRFVWDEHGETFGHRHSSPGATASWWYERLHGDDRERVVSALQGSIAQGAVCWSEEYRFRAADGRYLHVRDRARIVRDEAGDAVRVVGAVRDVTGRVRADLLAHGQSRLLEQIAAGLDLEPVLERVVRFTEAHGGDLVAAITVLDAESRTLRLVSAPSLAAELRATLADAPVEASTGLGALAAVRRERVDIPDLAAHAEAESWRAPWLAQGIRAAWATPLFATDGALLGTLELYYSVPRLTDAQDLRVAELASHLAEIALERARSQEALARSNRLLEQVLDTLPVGVWVLDRDGRIRFANPASRSIWGGARFVGIEDFGQFRGWRADTGEPISPEGWPAARAILAGETALDEMVQIEGFDGAQRTILNSAMPLRSLSGEILGAITLTQDITEQRAGEAALRRSEEQLRHAQKMEAVGQLAGGIAHDFNNLLTGILSYSELLLQELRPDDPLRGDIEQIRHAGQRAAGLTRQLLAFSRRQVLQPRVLSLNGVVTELEPMLRRVVGGVVELQLELDPALWHVLADPAQIEEVLVNLVVNGRDAMPQGGRLTIATANLRLGATDDARGNGVRPGEYVTLVVRDTGVGMDVPTQARIFEPFFTTKAPGAGSGLGLCTVYGIVEQSGGHIAVESAPGQGAAFTMFLPRHAGPVPAQARSDRRGLPHGTETLLLVEDEATVRSSARRLLERHGYTVVEARHGVEALRIIEEHAPPIDLVITDLVMPEMGGRELVERLHARQPGLKVLFMSGYSERAVATDGVMPPGTGFVEKPFTVEQLTRRTREILDS